MGRSMTAAPLSKSGRDKSRSEEHTSELQSQSNLVCRLLLEKKKNHFTAQVALAAAQTDAHSTTIDLTLTPLTREKAIITGQPVSYENLHRIEACSTHLVDRH